MVYQIGTLSLRIKSNISEIYKELSAIIFIIKHEAVMSKTVNGEKPLLDHSNDCADISPPVLLMNYSQ